MTETSNEIDPLNKDVWRPSKRQEKFLSLPDSVFEGFYGGAAGGGKSEVLLWLPIVKQFYLNKNFRGIIFRRSFPELEKSLIPRAKPIYERFGAVYNENKKSFTFPSGAIMYLSFLDKDKDARSHDTNEFHYIGFDELTSFTEFMFRYMTSRARSSDPTLPAFIRAASNPGNIGHAWVRKRFVEPAPEGEKIIKDALTGQRRIFIPAKLEDNPFLTAADPEYANRLKILPEAERRAKLDGDWWTFSGQVFMEFRAQQFPGEPEHAIHTCSPFDIPDWWPKFIAADWGYAHHTFILWGAMSPEGRLYIYREYVVNKTDISVWGANVVRRSEFDGGFAKKVIDPSAQQNRGSKTIYDQLIESHNFWQDLELADNDRLGGKTLLHEYLRWKPRPQRKNPAAGYVEDTANRILRMHGMSAYNDYIKSFLPEAPETNLPKLQIFNNCYELIKVLPLCIYDDVKTEDVKKFDGDDGYDCIRYLLKAADGYWKLAKKRADELKQRAEIVQDFEKNGDVNAYYRRLEYLEGTSKKVIHAVSRFNRTSFRRMA